jgi:hypothetical protein
VTAARRQQTNPAPRTGASPSREHARQAATAATPAQQALLKLQKAVGNRAVARALRPRVAPAAATGLVQREMKFEFQTGNKIVRNDGGTVTALPRKYGPTDFLVRGSSGVRLESETAGVIEFETTWDKKWAKLRDQIQEAFAMTEAINAAADVPGGRKAFPFDVPHLRTGTRKERRRGRWTRKKGMEGRNEKILKAGETLEVELTDATWDAGIQSSESFLLSQYESFLREHEFPDYREPVIADAQAILDRVNTGRIPAARLVNLLSFLQIIVNYIMRGQGGQKSEDAGAFADVEGMPSKQAFILMSRTDLSSMHGSLLSRAERRLFKKIVRNAVIISEMGLTKRTPFFVKGYGAGFRGPTVHAWLTGISKGKDLLSVNTGKGLSAAQGRFRVQKRKGKKDTGLVKFETRNREAGAFATAKDWEDHAFKLFESAATKRARQTGKGKTGLEV